MSSTSRRGLFGRRDTAPRASSSQLAGMTDAFFSCEKMMAELAPDVRAARQVSPGSIVDADWDAVRDRYDAVISRYLVLSAQDSPEATPQAVDDCVRGFVDASNAMYRFGQTYQRPLQAGRTARIGADGTQRRAREAATRATAALDAAPTEHIHLATVREAADTLRRDVAAAEAAGGLIQRQQAADRVVEAAAALIDRLQRAHGLAAEADRTIRSLQTRRQAVLTRLEGVPAMISQLLREFSSECSADLVDVPRIVRSDVEQASAHLDRARHLASSAPDESLDAAESARTLLTHADDELDRVHDRLTDLREVRADPSGAAARVRFRVRDAQNLALNQDLVSDWGSVLDAQHDRIDRAADALDRIHPDYWTYLTTLRAVDARVTDIVARMRDQVSGR